MDGARRAADRNLAVLKTTANRPFRSPLIPYGPVSPGQSGSSVPSCPLASPLIPGRLFPGCSPAEVA